jgi:hypothetical protein
MKMYSVASKTVWCLILLPWLGALAFSLPQLFFFDVHDIPGCNLRGCYDTYLYHPEWVPKAYITCFFIVVYVCPAMILLYTYTELSITIWRTVHERENGIINNDALRRTSSKDSYALVVHTPANHDNDAAFHNQKHNVANVQSLPVLPNNGRKTNGLNGDRRSINGQERRSTLERDRCSMKVIVHRANGHHRSARIRYRAVVMTASIVIVFIVSWAPYAVTGIWMLYDENAPKTSTLCTLFHFLFFY